MKEALSFFAVLTAFFTAAALLHILVNWLGLDGLPAFLIFCLPFVVLLSVTTCEDNESRWINFLRYAFWGYSFILAVAAIAWLIGTG